MRLRFNRRQTPSASTRFAEAASASQAQESASEPRRQPDVFVWMFGFIVSALVIVVLSGYGYLNIVSHNYYELVRELRATNSFQISDAQLSALEIPSWAPSEPATYGTITVFDDDQYINVTLVFDGTQFVLIPADKLRP